MQLLCGRAQQLMPPLQINAVQLRRVEYLDLRNHIYIRYRYIIQCLSRDSYTYSQTGDYHYTMPHYCIAALVKCRQNRESNLPQDTIRSRKTVMLIPFSVFRFHISLNHPSTICRRIIKQYIQVCALRALVVSQFSLTL